MAKAVKTLVIEDDAALWRPIAQCLKRIGFEAQFAMDGESAVEKMRENKPDLILLDWQLPGIQGIDLLGQLKSEADTEQIAVFMLTGRETVRDVEEAFDAGADDYIIKSLDMSNLGKVVKDKWKKHIKRPIVQTLVIEDDEILWKAVERCLSIHRFEAAFAADGPSGIQMARKTKPDLILLDWQMPGMEGTEVLAELKKDGSTKRIPVFMLTGREMISDLDEAFDSGADDYIIKPMDMSSLGKIVKGRWRKYKEKKGGKKLLTV